ncbi:uncharacterized protein G2W53_029385 [Senna tora]|uniref:Uncharacterized protein n=1 Tax=Senna tora TaxID=362788 RepID=A0A834T784_9FABA|nr:uncharacterized protein G2W53_029385 [Senna tora]
MASWNYTLPDVFGVWFKLLKSELNSSQVTDFVNAQKWPCVAFRLKTKEKPTNF